MSIFVILRVLYILSLGATCTVALRRGGRSERIGALIILLGSVFTLIVEQPGLFDWRNARTGLILVDVLVLVAFFMLALRTERFWPLWATSFHLIAVATHLTVFIEPRQILQAYALAQGFWAYPMLLTIIIGSLGQSGSRVGNRGSNQSGAA